MTRATVRQCVQVLLVALMTALVPSCGGRTGTTDVATTSTGVAAPAGDDVVVPDEQDEEQGGGVVGAPFDESGGGAAVGAPITIPDFTIVGADFSEQRPFIEDEFTRACGGTLCVEIVAVVRDVDGEPCEITDVPEGTAQRGSTVAFGIAQACDAEPSDEGEPSEDSEPSEDGEPAEQGSTPAEPDAESAPADPGDG